MQERLLVGKIAIVTGAASPMGLGRNMTEALVRAGARVSMMDISPDWLGSRPTTCGRSAATMA